MQRQRGRRSEVPVRLLTDSERTRLSSFPGEITVEDLYAYFTFTRRNRLMIPVKSAPGNRVGFALSLCAVRYLGFCPEELVHPQTRYL
jgi:hypothetical protein